MKTRFIMQFVALFFAVLLIATLTLGALGKLPWIVFWIVALLAVLVSYSLHRKP